jgi:hypothetical protein
MTFVLRLDVPVALPPEDHADAAYDAELDDVRSILRDLCASLAELPDVQFSLSIEEPLPVSVRRDLVIVMEQLRDVLTGLSKEGHATLDLYEQGIETQLAFSTEGAYMRVEQRDLLGRPGPLRKTDLPYKIVMESLRTLARSFVDAARNRSPERSAHPWFKDWAQYLLDAANR